MTVNRLRRGAAVLALAALGGGALAACASTAAKLTTAEAVRSAVVADTSQPGLRLTFRLDFPKKAVAAYNAAHPSSPVPGFEARMIHQFSLTVALHSGHGEALNALSYKKDHANALDITFAQHGTSYVELRAKGLMLYGRAHVTPLLREFSPASVPTWDAGLQRANLIVPGVSALRGGGWVSLNLRSMLKTLPPSMRAKSHPLPSSFSLTNLLFGNSRFVDVGTVGARHEYRVRLDAKTFVNQLMNALNPALGPSAGVVDKQIHKAMAAKGAPKTIRATLYTSSGRLSEVDVPLSQLSAGTPIVLRVSIASSGPIAAPASATPLNLTPLLRSVLAQSFS